MTNKISLKIKGLIRQFTESIGDMVSPGEHHDSKGNIFLTWIKVMIAASRKFIADECLTRATSIAYTTIVSLIPTLAVALSVFSLVKQAKSQKEVLFSYLSKLLIENNININADPLFSAISGLIDNTGKIGIIGAVVMVFSATAMLRSLETALNYIWKVKKQRSIFLKVAYYWSALTLGPLLLFAGATVATQVSAYIPGSILNFLAPFAFIWALFFFIYMVLPNIKVPVKYAAAGSTFTATVWVLFILLFIVYIRSFARGTFAIYGALVSIPFFLLLIYSSVAIILYGAEVSYTIMHPVLYRSLKIKSAKAKQFPLYTAISALTEIYKKFEQGKGASTANELSRRTREPVDFIEYVLNLYIEEGLLIRLADESLVPAMSSRNVKIADAVELIHTMSYNVPGHGDKSDAKKILTRIFKEIERSNKKIIGELTLNDLITRA